MYPPPVELSCPIPSPDSPVQVEVASVGSMEVGAYKVLNDGTEGSIVLSLNVGVIHHPKGTVLVDAGLGRTTASGEYPPWPFHPENIHITTPIVERVPDPLLVLMTHVHYDHIGGLLDLPSTPIWLWLNEYDYLKNFAFGVTHALKALDWRPIQPTARVLGVPATDVLGDGSIWYLQTPGHTPGAGSVLVQAQDGPWLFVGDTAWVDRHLGTVSRPLLTSLVVDSERHELKAALRQARWLAQHCPDLHMVTGHDARWMNSGQP